MENKKNYPEQEWVNAEARRYCEARTSNNSGQQKASFNAIIVKLCEKNAGNKILFVIYSELQTKHKYILGLSSVEDLMEYVFVFLHNSIDKYDYSRNPNFCAWFIQGFKWHLKNIIRKSMTTRDSHKDENGKKKPRLVSVPESSLEADNGENRNKKEPIYVEPAYERNDDITEMRVKLISVYTLFYERKKGKSANATKHEYYRIFVTEALIKDIKENNSLSTYNKQELMQVADGGFVRFVAFTDFVKAEDFITMKIKKYSDIFENGKKTELKLNHEAKVIIEYRFVNGFDKKRVSASAVSQQLSSFEEDMEKLMMQ